MEKFLARIKYEARKLVRQNRDKVRTVANALLKAKTLTEAPVKDIILEME